MLAIEARNLGKTYRVYAKPSDRLKELILRRPMHQTFPSLKDISFALPTGGTLGVIGENGAGKSTLLKILARTLTPSAGQLTIRGRLAALLELGAGFHPEFTGRQNIHLNARLLGLKDDEIRAREKEIIEFAELDEFIDRPIKTYSSGMAVRLGFSVATVVDPDILIIDEALSVGDAHFQKKCVDRLMQFREQGKTILFCSHSMYLVKELCHEAIWLERGEMRGYGPTSDVVSDYVAYMEAKDEQAPVRDSTNARSNAPEVVIDEVRVVGQDGQPLERIENGQDVTIRIKTTRKQAPVKGHVGIGLVRPDGQLLFGTTTKVSGQAPVSFQGEQVTELVIPASPLLSGTYKIKAMVSDEHTLHLYDQYQTESFLATSDHPNLGVVWIPHDWHLPGASRVEA